MEFVYYGLLMLGAVYLFIIMNRIYRFILRIPKIIFCSTKARPRRDFDFRSVDLIKTKVVRVVDGDGIEVIINGELTQVRLYGIDAPEFHQSWWDEATQALSKMIDRRQVTLEVYGQDRYGRKLASVFYEYKGTVHNANERMVMLGHAWVFHRYYLNLPIERKRKLNQLQTWARSNRVGLWSQENPTAPWIFRKQNPSDYFQTKIRH